MSASQRLQSRISQLCQPRKNTGGKLDWDEAGQAFLPGGPTEACRVAGAGAGRFGLGVALTDGAAMDAAAACDAGFAAEARAFAVEHDGSMAGVAPRDLATDRNPSFAKAFVEFQNDVLAKDIRLAVREGFRSVEHIKRYSTNGMATDQGKTSNINGLAIAADALKRPAPQVGLMTFRPPYTPTTFGAIAGYNRGDLFEVTRRTAIDPWAEANGAVFEPVSLWCRARYFPRGTEDMHAAVQRECRVVTPPTAPWRSVCSASGRPRSTGRRRSAGLPCSPRPDA